MVQASKQNTAKTAEKADWEGRYLENHRIETFKSTISLSTEIIKYLTLLNGGAVAGMLTTLDKLTKILSVGTIRWAVACFVVGLVFNGFGVFALYFSQTVAYKEFSMRPDRPSQRRQLIGAAMFQVFSLMFFCFGALISVEGLQT
ncbi:hypothetical protein [Collimonas fungivorans]|uniref:hypothetical protein n=1 Tax=Collimonas fungivorans TaxID=158899 RepID=UPI00059FA71C|nr:hypothetical protein [Collimonas fungivorans]